MESNVRIFNILYILMRPTEKLPASLLHFVYIGQTQRIQLFPQFQRHRYESRPIWNSGNLKEVLKEGAYGEPCPGHKGVGSELESNKIRNSALLPILLCVCCFLSIWGPLPGEKS